MEAFMQAAADNFGWILFVALLMVWAICDTVARIARYMTGYKSAPKKEDE